MGSKAMGSNGAPSGVWWGKRCRTMAHQSRRVASVVVPGAS